MEAFEKEIEVKWADCDLNRHVRHSVYYDYGAFIRIKFFAHHGFTTQKMADLDIGPILFKEECTFLKEIRLEDTVRINLLKGNVSSEGARWEMHHELFIDKGEKCAHISTKGAWIDITKRKLRTPPVEISNLIKELPQGDYFKYGRKKKEETLN